MQLFCVIIEFNVRFLNLFFTENSVVLLPQFVERVVAAETISINKLQNVFDP